MFNSEEKEFLRRLVKRELEHFLKEKKLSEQDASVGLLKAEHEYEHFVEGILEKLK